jgi:hypothetical protein
VTNEAAAKAQYDKQAGEPDDGFITPADAQEAIRLIYLDIDNIATGVAGPQGPKGDKGDALKIDAFSTLATLDAGGVAAALPTPTVAEVHVLVYKDTGGTTYNLIMGYSPGGPAGSIPVGSMATGVPASAVTLPAGWSFSGVLVGVKGDKGDTGVQGAAGAAGPQGPAGPTAVSKDANNAATLGTDGLIFAPLSASPTDLAALKRQIGVDFLHQPGVEGITDTPPTGLGPDDTDRSWIIGTAPTGAWAGAANSVATWTGTGWTYHTPVANETRLDGGSGKLLRWSGTAWVDVFSGFLPLTGGTLTGALTIALASPAANTVHLAIGTTNVRCKGNNLGIGTNPLRGLTTGTNNVGLSGSALAALTSSSDNVGIGNLALGALSTGPGGNIAIGTNALRLATGRESVAIGYAAGQTVVAGDHNTFIGAIAGGEVGGASEENTAVGRSAMGDGTTQTNHSIARAVAFGGSTAVTGDQGVAIGYAAQAVGDSVALGGALGVAGACKATAAKTVQMLPNATTGAKVYAGADRLFSLTELRAVVAASTDFNDFKARVAALT